MNTHRKNFEAWYVDVLKSMYPYQDAGFAILMITFPLLERYLRQKTGLSPQGRLNEKFYCELMKVFMEIPDHQTAQKFWQVFRNGILHEVTMPNQNRSGEQMPIGLLSYEKPEISIDADGRFWINPRLFSAHVVQIIEEDFPVFEGEENSPSRLPKVKEISSNEGPTVLGTSAER